MSIRHNKSLSFPKMETLFYTYFHQDSDLFYGTDVFDEKEQIRILIMEFMAYADSSEIDEMKKEINQLLALSDSDLILENFFPELSVVPALYEGGARGLLKNILRSIEISKVSLLKHPRDRTKDYGLTRLLRSHLFKDFGKGNVAGSIEEKNRIFQAVKYHVDQAEKTESEATKFDVQKLLSLSDSDLDLKEFIDALEIDVDNCEGGARGLLENILLALGDLNI